MYEQHRDRTMATRFNVDNQRYNNDSLQDTIEYVKTMKATNKEMKKLRKERKELDPDYVMDIMEDLQQTNEQFEEVRDAVSIYDVPLDVDDSDLMAEMDMLGEELLQDIANEETPVYLQEFELPNAPANQEREEREDLQESNPLVQ